MRCVSPRASGFTLVELTVVIVVAAIVASFIVLFLDAPIQSYFAQTRRSDLVDSADRITNAVTADVRSALPNSVRVTNAGSVYALEFLATQGVARYYDSTENPTDGLAMGVPLPLSGFETLDSFTPLSAPPYNHLSVGNLGYPPTVPTAYDAYSAGNNVMTPGGVTITAGAKPGESQVKLSASMTFQAPVTPPAAHNAYLVSGPVSYICDPTTGTFMRYSNYGVTASQTVTPGGTSALIAHDVSSCNIYIVFPRGGYPPPAAGYSYGELAVLTVTLSNGGESLQVFLEAPTGYSQ